MRVEGEVQSYGESGSCFWCNDGLALEVVIGLGKGGAYLLERDRMGYRGTGISLEKLRLG